MIQGERTLATASHWPLHGRNKQKEFAIPATRIAPKIMHLDTNIDAQSAAHTRLEKRNIKIVVY